jgi:TonB family protein
MVVDGDKTPALPTSFTPAPFPGEPDPPPPDKMGLSYLKMVHAKLRPAWRAFVNDARLRLPPSHALNDTKLFVELDVTVGAKGSLRGIAVATSSGNNDFDQAALEIARDAAPFPLPERDMISDDDLLHLRWLFARDRRLAGVSTARIDRILWPVERSIPKYLATGNLETAAQRLEGAINKELAAANPARKKQLMALGRRIAVVGLRQALQGKKVEIQRAAVRAAAIARAPEVAPQLRTLATSVVDHGVRTEAVRALGLTGNEASIPLLESILRGERGTGGQSAVAAEALVRLGRGAKVVAEIQRRLGSAKDEEREKALTIAALAPAPPAISSFRKLLRSRGTAKAIRIKACTALGRAATKGNRRAALTGLLAGTRAGDAAVRAACMRGIGVGAAAGMRSRGAFWRSVELLKKDRDERVRAASVLAAARLQPTLFKNVLYLMTRERSTQVFAALAEALGYAPGRAAFRWLVKLARHKDAEVRLAAARSLTKRTEPKAKSLLASMIKDKVLEIRLIAIDVLDGASALAPYLGAHESRVRMQALLAYVRQKGKLAALPEILGRLRQSGAGSIERARVASAWLAATK